MEVPHYLKHHTSKGIWWMASIRSQTWLLLRPWWAGFFLFLCCVQGFVVHGLCSPAVEEVTLELCHTLCHSKKKKKSRASSAFLGISYKEPNSESIVSTILGWKSHWVYQMEQAFCYRTMWHRDKGQASFLVTSSMAWGQVSSILWVLLSSPLNWRSWRDDLWSPFQLWIFVCLWLDS